jgi:hypothetical protein
MGTHRDVPSRLTLRQWLRYRRLLRAVVQSAWRKGEPLDRATRGVLRKQARRAAREVG